MLYAGTVDEKEPEPITNRSRCPKIVKELLGYHIIQVSCGGQHAAAVTSSGQLFTWGRGGFGRLGHSSTANIEVPTVVNTLLDLIISEVGLRV